MNRKSFIRDLFMSVALATVPKILMPAEPEVVEDVDAPAERLVPVVDPYRMRPFNFPQWHMTTYYYMRDGEYWRLVETTETTSIS